MARFYCSALAPVPTDPPLRLVLEAPDEAMATVFAKERLGASGLIVKRTPDPDVELKKDKDGTMWIREIDETGWLGAWRKT